MMIQVRVSKYWQKIEWVMVLENWSFYISLINVLRVKTFLEPCVFWNLLFQLFPLGSVQSWNSKVSYFLCDTGSRKYVVWLPAFLGAFLGKNFITLSFFCKLKVLWMPNVVFLLADLSCGYVFWCSVHRQFLFRTIEDFVITGVFNLFNLFVLQFLINIVITSEQHICCKCWSSQGSAWFYVGSWMNCLSVTAHHGWYHSHPVLAIHVLQKKVVVLFCLSTSLLLWGW